MVYILAAMLCLLVLGTAFSRAGRLAQSLQQFKNRPVEIRIWGQRLPIDEIESIRALGAALHLFVRRGGSRTEHVKIAQPRLASVSGETAQIVDAKYVQWERKQYQRVAGQPALTLAVSNERGQHVKQ